MIKEFLIRCDCGCGVIGFDLGFDDMYVVYYESNFSSQQQVIKSSIKQRIKMIWSALTCKPYRVFDIVVPKERLSEFKEWVKSI